MKVGDYVRTKYGIIAKITDIIEDFSIDCDIDVYYEDSLKDNSPMMEIPYNLKDEYIIKSSPNIIDLIEVGDYVNGCLVLHKENNELVCGLLLKYKEENIENIVTREQFERMQYNLESEVN